MKTQLPAPVKNKPKGEQAVQQDHAAGLDKEHRDDENEKGPAEDIKVPNLSSEM